MDTRTLDSQEAPSPWERGLLAGGIIAGIFHLGSMALFGGLVAPQMPPFESAAAVKAAFYAEQAASPIYTWVRLLIFAQLAPLALFFGGLSPLLRRAEGGGGALAGAVVNAGIFGAILAPATELVEGHMLLGLSAVGADPAVAVGFDGMTPVALGLSGIPQLVMLVGAGLLLGGRLIPRWVAWLGHLAALVGLLGVGVVFAQPLFAFGLLGATLVKIWMIALSVALLRRPRAAPRAAPHPRPA